MKYRQKSSLTKTILILIIIFFATPFSSMAQDNDMHADFGVLLEKYVNHGVVDYLGLKKEEGTLDQYLTRLAKTDPNTMNDNDRLAFYINAYNAYTMKLILKNFKNNRPLKSIKKIGGFFTKPWSIKFATINGKDYTLDNIEHDIIRPSFKDPRVHFAINCAALSCPPLLAGNFSGATIDEQLTNNTIAFINNPNRNYLKNNRLYVSKIFKWFAEDFNDDPLTFFRKYAKGELKRKLEAGRGKIKVRYLDYDWSLNDK